MSDAENGPETIDMLGSRLERVVRMGTAEDDAVLFRTRMGPHDLVPLHSHVDPECFYVLSGELEVFLEYDGPGWRPVMAGQSLLVRDGIRHAVRNPGEEPVDLVVVTNNRLADFFREAGRPAAHAASLVPPSKADFERVARAAERFGYGLATPAESTGITGFPR